MNVTGNRKFALTLIVLGMSFAALMADKLEGGGWVTLATLALSIYGAANVVDKMKGGQG